jgi:uncharacterized protein (TIGR02391 family)
MSAPEDRNRLFFTTVGLIGNIVLQSHSLNGIDQLFTRNGADPNWVTNEPIPYNSEKQRRVYHWLLGVERYAPNQTFVVAHRVLTELADSASIVTHNHRMLARNLLERIEQFSGIPSTRPRRPSLDSRVMEAAGDLYANRHYSEAVQRAFVALINAVRAKSGRDAATDRDAMTLAFRDADPALRLSQDANEQQGYMYLFAGATAAIRNPLSHTVEDVLGADEAYECLVFASLLFRYLDRSERVNRQGDQV